MHKSTRSHLAIMLVLVSSLPAKSFVSTTTRLCPPGWTAVGCDVTASPARVTRRHGRADMAGWCRDSLWDVKSGLRAHSGKRGLPENDEGIADLESLHSPSKEKDYGDDGALQYGVSSVAATSADHFFSSDTRIVFGINALEIGLVELHEIGLKRPLIVTGWNQARADPIVWELLPRGFDLTWHSVSAEPSLSDVTKGAQVALGHRVDCVIAMGGAAVIDAGKAIAAIAYADKDFKGAVRRLLAAATESREPPPAADDEEAAPLLGPVPMVAIPMIAGLGAEVTPMATVLRDDDPIEPERITIGFDNTAAALPSPFMAIIEPRLHMRVPLDVTWPRAFAALAGCLEGYVTGQGFIPDLLSHQGMERISTCLSKNLGFRGPLYQEREDIAFAGIIRGLVASRTGWGILHKLASAVSVACGAPYAVCVTRLFPRVLEAQIESLRRDEQDFAASTRNRRRTDLPMDDEQDPVVDNPPIDVRAVACSVIPKYRRAACYVTGDAGATPEDIAPWLDERLLDKNIPPLFQAGLRPEHAPVAMEELNAMRGGISGMGAGRLDETTLRMIILREASMPRRESRDDRTEAEAGIGTTGNQTIFSGPWQKRQP